MKTARPLIFCPRKLAPVAAIRLWFLVLCCGTCFGQVISESGQEVNELLKDLTDQKANVRSSAALALGQIGPKAKAAVPALIEALKETQTSCIRS